MHVKNVLARRRSEHVEATFRTDDFLQLGTVQKLTLGSPGNKVKDGKYFYR